MSRQGIKLPPKDKLWKPLTNDEVDKIVNASLKVLKEVGVFVENETILQTANENGCTINKDKKLIFFPEDLVNEFIKKAPKDILWSGRNQDDDLLFSASNPVFKRKKIESRLFSKVIHHTPDPTSVQFDKGQDGQNRNYYPEPPGLPERRSDYNLKCFPLLIPDTVIIRSSYPK